MIPVLPVLKTNFCWNKMRHSLLGIYQYFLGECCLFLQRPTLRKEGIIRPKLCQISAKIQGVTSQKAGVFGVTAVRIAWFLIALCDK